MTLLTTQVSDRLEKEDIKRKRVASRLNEASEGEKIVTILRKFESAILDNQQKLFGE